MSRVKVLGRAVPISIACLFAVSAEAQSVTPSAGTPRANPITNPDGSVTVAVPPFNPQGGVFARARPDYDPLGVRIGNFVMLPAVTAGALYNSNVFNTQTGAQSDWAFELEPTLQLVSDLPRHALSFVVGAHSLFYNRLTSENTTDVTVSGRGQLDIQQAANIVLEGGYQYLHEGRGTLELPGNAAEPTEYSVTTAQGTFNRTFSRVQISAGASLQRFDYRNTKLLPPGPSTLDNRDRDRDIVNVFGQAGYEFSPGYAAFLRGTYNERNYDLTFDQSGYRHDSRGSEVNGGIQFELTRLLIGQIYAGYLYQNFDDYRFATVSGAAYGAQFEWYPTELTTLRANVRRSVEETTVLGLSSYTTSHFALGLDHELLRNVIISLDGLYDYNDFNGSPRTDKFWGFAPSLVYLMNRNMQVNFGYVLSGRDSNLAGYSYTNNSLRLGLVGKL